MTIMVAEKNGLCQRIDLDLSLCREPMILPGKILLFNKKGLKIGLIKIQSPIVKDELPKKKAEIHAK